MPEAALAEAPPAQATPQAPAAPAAKPEIAVSTMPKSNAPPAKKGSALARMQDEVAKFGTRNDPPAAPEAKPAAAAPKPAGAPTGEETPAAEAKPGGEAQAAVDPKDKTKKNPWKMLDEERANTRKLQEQIAEANKRAIPETEWKSHQERMTAVEKRNKELEDEIRYVNYQKSDEFQKKYQEPYKAAWNRAISELGELQVDDGSGAARAFNAKDLLELVNMPLQKAREAAVAKYGEFADDVMQHRKEVRRLHEEQAAALEEVKKNGATRDKEMSEKAQREQAEVINTIKETWNSENESATKHEKYGKYFTPKEGDQEGNQKLAKGYELADRAFTENPFAQGLTAEQRKAIVARHAVVRNRCAAFGRLTHDLEKSSSRIAELEAELAKFKGAEPGTIDPTRRGNGQPASAQGGKAMDRMKAELEKRAIQR